MPVPGASGQMVKPSGHEVRVPSGITLRSLRIHTAEPRVKRFNGDSMVIQWDFMGFFRCHCQLLESNFSECSKDLEVPDLKNHCAYAQRRALYNKVYNTIACICNISHLYNITQYIYIYTYIYIYIRIYV